MQITDHNGTSWFPQEKLIVSRLSGEISKQEIERWEQSLLDALAKPEDNSTFKILVDLHGFTAINLDAHKRFRDIVPLTLAKYGWKVGYVDLFEEEARQMHYTHTRGIRCVRAAHTHQDETKIGLYESRYSREDERYFTDRIAAVNWLLS